MRKRARLIESPPRAPENAGCEIEEPLGIPSVKSPLKTSGQMEIAA